MSRGEGFMQGLFSGSGRLRCHHYLGYVPLTGAQIRYFIEGNGQILGALGIGASAWKVAPRDLFIGWTHEQRQAHLHLIVNNSRFLILPWVRVKYLVERPFHAMALAAVNPLGRGLRLPPGVA